MSLDQGPYQLLSSTRFDPFLTTVNWNNDHDGPSSFFLLPYHFDRLASAAKTHKWNQATSVFSYDYLKSACSDAISEQQYDSSSAFRIRITLSQDGQIVVSATPLAASFASDPTSLSIDKPPPIDHDSKTCMKIYMDTEAITSSLFTTTKTTFRDVYDNARARNEKRLQPGSDWSGSDVLLYNDKGYVMEATVFNVAFYQSSKWVTPSMNSGCLPGVMRRWLLQSCRISEDESRCLTRDSIRPGEWVLLFNGVQGCRLGRVYM